MTINIPFEIPDDVVAKLPLPSDAIPAGTFRRLSPELDYQYVDHINRMRTIILGELNFVRLGFATAGAGKKGRREVLDDIAMDGTPPDETRKEMEDSLVDSYIRYGIADGPATAKQIIRGLEDMGAQLARAQRGRTAP